MTPDPQPRPAPAPAHPVPLSAYDFDTTPGARGALAPPADFAGDRHQYLALMRQRYHQDHEARQCILIAALRTNQAFGDRALTFRGPFADWAREVILTTARRLRAPAPGT